MKQCEANTNKRKTSKDSKEMKQVAAKFKKHNKAEMADWIVR